MASVARALAAVFPHMLVLPGTTSVVVASGVPLERDAAPLIARLGERAIKSRLVRAGYLEYLLSDGRPQELAARIAATPAPANTDGRPVCYAYAAIVWLARFFPRLAFTPPVWLMGEASFRAPLAALVFVVAGLLIARRSPTGRSTALVAIAGFVGMVAESVLILHYQAARGALFRDLGALLTSFMAGLALGAWAVPRLRAPWTGAALAGGLAGLGLAVALEVRWGFAASLPGIALVLFVAGLVVGGVFAQASLAAVADRARLVSPLYAADLLGGAAGGLLVSLVLVPAFGLEGSAYGLAALGAASFLLLTSARP
jgi:spermidine synthase